MIEIVSDMIYPRMYRINWPDIGLSDMVNKTRAKDAIAKYLETERSNQYRRVR